MTGGKKPQLGFTIVETLIFLAVSAVIFLSAVILIAGKTNQTEFTQATQDVQSQVQGIINNIANGYYPNENNFNCIATGSPQHLQISTLTANGQGTNAGCLFVGKVVQFGVHGSDPEQYVAYTIAGLQTDSTTGNNVQSYAGAVPLAIAQGNNLPGSGVPAALTGAVSTLQYGLTATNMWYCATNTVIAAGTQCGAAQQTAIGAVGFLSSLAAYDSSNSLVSGSQHVNLIPIGGTGVVSENSTLGESQPDMADTINNYLENATGASSPDSFTTTNPPSAVQICFKSGTTQQSALMTITEGAAQPTVNIYPKTSSTNCT